MSTAAAISTTKTIVELLSLIPAGILLGVMTERAAISGGPPSVRNIISARAWNSTVKGIVGWLLFRCLLLPRGGDNDNSLVTCAPDDEDGATTIAVMMDYLQSLLWGGSNSLPKCSSIANQSNTMTTGLLIVYLAKWVFLCVAIRLGEALQPVGITGGIGSGKSTVANLLQKSSSETTTTNNNDSTRPSGFWNSNNNTRRDARLIKRKKKDAFVVIDLDTIGHDILIPGKMAETDSAYETIVKEFGHEILLDPNTSSDHDDDDDDDDIDDSSKKLITQVKGRPLIDRRKLGDIVFRNDDKRNTLNGIIHPLISKVMMKRIVIESYRLSSSKTHKGVVSVDCPLLFEIGFKMKVIFGIKMVVACSSDVQLERLMKRNTDLTREQCVARIDSQMPLHVKATMADIVLWNDGTLHDLRNEVERARAEVMERTVGYGGMRLVHVVFLLGLTSLCAQLPPFLY